ncbi:hypothetical protein TNCV_845091 [Trichonephila clavipes]|uniref:Uncharacterized protein n=1 Tax=Trichonephila clavipes TaxID=2585209 RepID=A0A8X6WI95_TRICX|nr:hypothetical protein TNCV_845091 [Trichonephila clavipes]
MATGSFVTQNYSRSQKQSAFHRHFDISPRGRIPDRKCVLMGMDAFRATENITKERNGPPKSVRSPENEKRVRVSIQIESSLSADTNDESTINSTLVNAERSSSVGKNSGRGTTGSMETESKGSTGTQGTGGLTSTEDTTDPLGSGDSADTGGTSITGSTISRANTESKETSVSGGTTTTGDNAGIPGTGGSTVTGGTTTTGDNAGIPGTGGSTVTGSLPLLEYNSTFY